MFSMIKVQGTSMVPCLQDGDFVFIGHWLWSVKIGDLVVVDHALYRFIVKRVIKIAPNGALWVCGENENSLQPEDIGWITSKQLVGKVLYCVCAKTKTVKPSLKNNKNNKLSV